MLISQKEVEEGNKLIAEYMESNYKVDYSIINFNTLPHPKATKHSYEVDELEYLTSWDWIIPVCKKLASVPIEKADSTYTQRIHLIELAVITYDITFVFMAVIDLLKIMKEGNHVG